jgi:hypothetical protein
MLKQLTITIVTGLFALIITANAQELNPTYWSDAPSKTPKSKGLEVIKADAYRTVKIDLPELRKALSKASSVNNKQKENSVIIALPHPDGTSSLYEVWENNTMHAGLKAKFPEIKAYDAIGLSGDFAKIDVTPHGFHAMILSSQKGSMFIDPYSMGDTENYKVYFKRDFRTDKQMKCDLLSKVLKGKKEFNPSEHKEFGTCELRTYRFAVAATGEYTAFHGGTVALAQAAQVTTMNRVNGLYERDMAITMTIIANNNLIVFTNAGTDPYTNGTPGSMINENQTEIDATIGSSNYDIGHVFGTNSGGLAGLGVVCSGSQKARGVTGSSAPVGDPFDIDYVAHETGHQFGANHTQNNSCNRNNATAMEPGSASTIMGYAGICAPNVQSNSDDHFHGVSLEEIHDEIMSGGHTCEAITSLTNTAPTITATNGNVTVPANTPFALTATVTDPDGDVLEYCWEQMDNTPSTQPPVATSTDGPNFRSNIPVADPTRYFPNLPDLAAGITPTWEVVPSVTRTMNFRVTVRDKPHGVVGCNDHADVTVTTDAGSGPFVVTYPTASGITWAGTSTETVTWNVANTDNAPVSCAQVDILLSTDGGLTYPTVLASSVPNDGSETITVPNVGTTTARVMVICSNGTFLDISDNDFEITIITSDYTLAATPSSVTVCQPADAVFTVDVGTFGGYVDPVSLSATGVPAGATGSFGATSVVPGNTTAFTVSNTGLAAPGTYTITISGNSTTGIKDVDVDLTISGATPSLTVLASPADGATGISLPVNFNWSAAGPGDVYDIDIATDAAFTSIIDNAVGLTTNTFVSSALSSGTVYYWRVKAYNACGDSGYSSVFSFETTNEISLPPTGTATTQTTCTGILYDSGGSGSDYDNDEDAQITISPTGAATIDLSFISFDIEPGSAGNCDYDWLEIFDGPTTGSPLIDRYCNDNMPTSLSTTGGSVTVVFHSDGGATHAGFQMNWQCNLSSVPPVANFSADVDTTCRGLVNFLDLSTNGPTQWSWDFGDGNTSTLQSPQHTYSLSGDYTVELTAINSFGSDTLTVANMIYVALPAAPITIGASVCDSGSMMLSASGTGILNWYDAPTGGTIVNTGGTYTTPVLYAPVAYFVEAEVAQPSLYGAKPDNSGGGANFNSNQHLKFDVYEDFEIVSVEVYANGAGNRTIELRDNTGAVINTLTVNIPDGTSRVDLNFMVNPGTDYQLGVDASGMIDLYRNNSSVSYPYDLAGMGSVTRSSAVTAGGMNHYYFFYDWEIRGPSCLSARVPVSARVYVSPTVSGGPDQTICEGDSVTLSGSGALSYSWTGGVIDGAQFGPTIIGATSYTVTGTDVNGCQDTADVVVTVNANPTADAGVDQLVCEGDTVTLSGSGANTYVWDGGVLDNVGFLAAAPGTTSYVVIGTDTAGCKDNDTVDVTVNELPTIISETPVDVSACGLSDGSITIVVSGGTGAYTYSADSGATFFTNGGIFTGLAAGTYHVAVDDGACPITGSTIVISAPGTPPAPSAVNDTVYCEGESISDLMATGTSGTLNWYSDPGLTTNIGSGANLTPGSTTGTTTYYVAENVSGCEGPSTAIEITINPTPNVEGGSDQVVCEGDSVTLFGSGAITYSWTGGIMDNVTFAATAPGTTAYTLVGTDVNDCKGSDTVEVTVNVLPVIGSETPVDVSACGLSDGSITIAVSGGTGSYTYSVDSGSTFVANGGVFTGLAAGTYNVFVDDGACPIAGSELVISGPPPPPAPSGGPDTTYCEGDTVSDLYATGTAGTLNWYSDPGLTTNIGTGGTLTPSGTTGTTTYYVAETIGACEGLAASIDVTINALPNVNGGGDQSVCEGDSVTLNGSGATSYTWDNGVVNGDPFMQTPGTTTYMVIGTDGNGCENSDTVDVSVVAYPDISVTNDGVSLTAEAGYSYQWVDCDSNYADILGETNQSFTPTVSGNYAVIVDNAGCVDTSSCFLLPVSTIYIEGGNEDISIYPNPSSGKFHFELGNPYSVEQIVIFDATGRLIHLVNVNNKTRVDIDISTNSAGVYFCKIEGNGSVQVHRLIIE